jgi:dTDP-L-rhamnose 4-epimerase
MKTYNNILITGGAGFIGSSLSVKLVSLGYNVSVLDNLSSKIHGDYPKESFLYKKIENKVKFVQGDVTKIEDWIKVLKDVEVIVHLAAETGTGQSMYDIQNYVNVNINGTSILLDYLANNDNTVKKIIIASSRAVYGEGKYYSSKFGVVYPEHRTEKYLSKGDFEVKIDDSDEILDCMATDEKSLLHPSSLYGITKLNQEQMIMTVCPTLNISPVAFRYQNVYGPGQSLKNPYTGILSIFSTQIKNFNTIKIFEDGKESRDFVYIEDVVNATILGIEKEEANGEIFNVGSGAITTVLDVAKELVKNYDSSVSIEITKGYRLGDIRHNYADLTKITTLLGFQPKIDFKNGIKNFTNWVNSQEVEIDKLEESILELERKKLIRK